MRGRVLIASPVHPIKEYSIPAFLKAIQELDFPSWALTKVMINTSELKTRYHLSAEGWISRKIEIDQTPDKFLVHRRLAAAMNLAREMCLEGGYDYLFSVECDVIVPPFALKKLIEADKPIIEGLYYTDFDFHPPSWWIAGDVIKECTPRGTMGVCLVKREVLEQVGFRYSLDEPKALPDHLFHYDASKKGFRSFVHCGVVCDHLVKPSGSRGWEDLENADLIKKEDLK